MISSGTITHCIDRLEQAELVWHIPDLSDRRGMRIELTPQGVCVIEQAVEAHVANEHRLLSVLKESEREVLAQLLRQLLEAFEK